MCVTQVEMLLSNADRAQVAKMLDWLNSINHKFLFDSWQRRKFGLIRIDCNWPDEDILVESTSRTGHYVDFRFTVRIHGYPHVLALVLHKSKWKIKARYRQIDVDRDTPWSEMHFSDRWTHLCDKDFPLWGASADRARQTGTATTHGATQSKHHKNKRKYPV